jgi:pimeloyl-ACP methyl ester carboxylesterase
MNGSFFSKQLNDSILLQYNLVSLDLPGHGTSLKLDNYSIPNLLNIILNDLSDFENMVLIGHSLGGHLAIQLLPQLKNRCKGIFIFGTPPMRIPLNVEDAFVLNEHSAKFLQKDIDDISILNLAKIVYNKEDDIFQKILVSLKKTDGKFREDFALSLMNEEINDEIDILDAFNGKIVIAVGENDALVNIQYLKSLKINNLWLNMIFVIKNSGHAPHIENPDELNKLLALFVESLK